MTKPNQAHCLAKNVDGRAVRDDYLKQAAELLARHGHLRNFGLAFGLFSHKPQAAAHAAAQRVIAAGVQEGYFLAATDEITRRRFYALTIKGAKFLAGDSDREVKHTTATLRYLTAGPGDPDQPARKKTMVRWEHREWSSLIAIAAEKRGLLGLSEHEAWGTYKSDLEKRYGHIPDALTFSPDPDPKSRLAVWHEVEFSRRNRSYGKDKDGKAITERVVKLPKKPAYTIYTGERTLLRLIETLRLDEAPLTHEGNGYVLNMLVLHVRDSGIEKELRTLIETRTNAKKQDSDTYTLARPKVAGVRPEVLYIMLNTIPSKVEDAWPVPGTCQGCLPIAYSVGTPWPAEDKTGYTRPAKANAGAHKPKLGGRRMDVVDQRVFDELRKRAAMAKHEYLRVPLDVRDEYTERWLAEVEAAWSAEHAEPATEKPWLNAAPWPVLIPAELLTTSTLTPPAFDVDNDIAAGIESA